MGLFPLLILAGSMCRETQSIVACAMLDAGAGTELVAGSVRYGALPAHVKCFSVPVRLSCIPALALASAKTYVQLTS